MFEIIDLTQPLPQEAHSYPGDDLAYRAETTPIVNASGVVTRLVQYELHSGTHMDAPLHFAPNGIDIANVPLRILPAHVVTVGARRIDTTDVPDVCKGLAILFHTGWDRHVGQTAYFSDYPFLTAAAAQLLVDRNAALVGLDTPSVDDRTDSAWYPAHRTLCAAGVPIVEGLVNLQAVLNASRSLYFAAFPIPFGGIEASPVRAVAFVDTAD